MGVVATTLRRARARIEAPEAWTREYLALDAEGEPTDPDSPDAVAWCAIGALQAEGCEVLPAGDEEAGEPDIAEWSFLNAEAKRWGYASIEAFNDAQTHALVLGLFDRAAAMAREAEGAPPPEGGA